MDCDSMMNPKGIAQEIVNWYLLHLEPYDSHVENVHNYLHGPVLSVTHKILENDDSEEFATTTTASSAPSSSCCKEKKECHGTRDSCDSDSGVLLLDKNQWEALCSTADNKQSNNNRVKKESLYESLGRRRKARMDAFFAGVSLAVPGETNKSAKSTTTPVAPPKRKSNQKPPPSSGKEKISSQKGSTKEESNERPIRKANNKSPVLTSLNHHGKALLRSVSADPPSVRIQPQIGEKELLVRLELYVRSLYRVKALNQECVIAAEPPRAINARVGIIVSAFVSTVGCVRSMSPTLTHLLTCLTRELLAVEYLGQELMKVIRRLVSEYERGTSFASLAFLSSPEASAENRLTPMLFKYIRYLQSGWKLLEQECELERMLTLSLDSNMRRYFKTVEFQSIGHLLEVCHGFRNELNNIELAPSSTGNFGDNSQAVAQAIRDLQREVITINGKVLPTVTSRQELIGLLSQSLNSRTLAAPSDVKHHGSESSAVHRIESCPSLINTERGANAEDQASLDDDAEGPNLERKNSLGRRASFHLSTVDVLTRRLLIAASRTGTGGDAYFIVRDLFGDDDVEVVPAKVLPHHVRASRVGSIEIQVRLASVTIKCHGSFDIYPKSLVGSCEPLIQLHTTTSEVIYLQEKRSNDSSNGDGVREDDGSSTDGMENMILQEHKTHKTGWRMLSIRPALYEKVQVWNTPS